MLPLKDHNRSGRIPIITLIIIFINIIVFIYMMFLPKTNTLYLQFIYSYATIPGYISKGARLHTLLTSMFLHSGLGHIMLNMWFLYIFGDNMEYTLGRIRYLVFYIVCGVFASLSQIIIDPGSIVPAVGASGAIAGVMGGYLVLFPNARIDILIIFGFIIRVITVSAYFVLMYWIFFQVILGLGSLSNTLKDNVAYFAHIGGFISGYVLIKIYKKFKGWY